MLHHVKTMEIMIKLANTQYNIKIVYYVVIVVK